MVRTIDPVRKVAAHNSCSWDIHQLVPRICFFLVFSLTTLVANSLAQVTAKRLEVSGSAPGFTRLPPGATGVLFSNSVSSERSLTNRNLLSGSGIAAGDIDNDGLVDLYFCGLDTDNVLYRNLGNWKFEDITTQAGVTCAGDDSTAPAFADVDGDDDLDLLVNGLGTGTRLFLNDGKGKFAEATDAAGLRSRKGSTSMALADVEGDGDLDLYVANFRPTTLKDLPNTNFRVEYQNNRPVITHVNGRPTSTPDLTNRFVLAPSGTVLEMGETDQLWLNEGDGKFTLLPFTGGAFLDEDGKPLTTEPNDWGLAVQFYDFTGDRAPDIYVCNDLYTPDRIWINDGKGRFKAIPRLALRNTSTFSMGVDFGDLDRDGDFDFFVVDMLSRDHSKRMVQVGEMSPIISPVGLIDNRPQIAQNTLQLNRGDGTFAEVSRYAGVEASEWSWGPILMDVDLDGYEDIIISNGQERDYQNADIARKVEEIKAKKQLSLAEIQKLFEMFPGLRERKVLFRNRGDLTFEEVGEKWGFDTLGISQGMALADLDNDGDQDLVINNLGEPAGIYRNNSPAPRVAVRLTGEGKNTRGIGAKIKLTGGPLDQQQEMISAGRYVSADDPMRTFAAGAAESLKLEITWRDGRVTFIPEIKPNHSYTISQTGTAQLSPAQIKPLSPGLFDEITNGLPHLHVDEFFDDLQRQLLIPLRLSQLGPGLSFQDFDDDGWEDLVIGSGRSGKIGVYRNLAGSSFTNLAEQFLQRPVARDQTTILGLESALIVGSANYEDGTTNGGWIRIYDLQRKVAGENLLGPDASTGPIAAADFNGDGSLDLFIGARVKPGRYPESAPSMLLVNQNKRFVQHQKLPAGQVSGAVFTDIDNDSDPDLVLATHWGPIRIYVNANGTFSEVTESLGLSNLKGLWNGIASGDFDGDGKLDLLASNWGLNTAFEASTEHPLKLYYSDPNNDGVVDLVQARFDANLQKEVPLRNLNLLGMAFPAVREKVGTFEAYGKAGVEDIFEPAMRKEFLEVNELRSVLLLNRGNRFETRPLPREAQFAPGFGICIADFDGDGHDDAFLAQNFFATNPEMVRADAGRGLLLKGDGQGNLHPMPGSESGLAIYGEQRGAAVADFDHDGRMDLVVTQNGATTKLYKNRSGQPGLRVRLRFGGENQRAIGAKLRVKNGSNLGTVREIQAGSGYWSQNSSTVVINQVKPGSELVVRWPNGKETITPLSQTVGEIAIDQTGAIIKSK